MIENQRYDYAVVGGGVYGLSIAYYLCKHQFKVALFQQFSIPHKEGSSHGSTRICRAVYQNQVYTKMSRTSVDQNWKEMEQILQSKFMYQCPYIFFDEVDAMNKSKTVSNDPSGNIKLITVKEAKQKFTNLPDIDEKFLGAVDQNASIIAASKYISKLHHFLQTQQNLTIYQNTPILKVQSSEHQVSILTKNKEFKAKKVALACGRWISQLSSEVKEIIEPLKQYVLYMELFNLQDYKFGSLPSFLIKEKSAYFYCLPELEKGQGVKFGKHILHSDSSIDNEESVKKYAEGIFGKRLKFFKELEICYYTSTQTEDFIIDWSDPEKERILVCSCCSGHGFKFAPLIGSIVGDLFAKNKSVDIFEENRYIFNINYHKGVNLK